MSESLNEIYRKIEGLEHKVDQQNQALSKIASFLEKRLKAPVVLLKTGDKAKINQDLTLNVPIVEEKMTDTTGKEFLTFKVQHGVKDKEKIGDFTVEVPEGTNVSVNQPGEEVTSVTDIKDKELYSPELHSNVTVEELLVPNESLEKQEK